MAHCISHIFIVLAGMSIVTGAAQQPVKVSPLQTHLYPGSVKFESMSGRPLDALVRFQSGASRYTPGEDRPDNEPQYSQDGLTVAKLELAMGLSDLVEDQLFNDISRVAASDSLARSELSTIAYYLAQEYYKNGQPSKALQALDLIERDLTGISPDSILYLRALASIDAGLPGDAASILENIGSTAIEKEYILYNLAIAYVLDGDIERARTSLISIGDIRSQNTEIIALKDLSFLILGHSYLQSGSPDKAITSFNNVRLDSPYTDQALLGSGWASFLADNLEQAIARWKLLHERRYINDSIIEAKLALPYAYSRSGAHGKATNLYAHAMSFFETEIERLDTASRMISNGDLSSVIISGLDSDEQDWELNIMRRAAKQQQSYLPLLLSDSEFHRIATNLRHLARVTRRIDEAKRSLPAFIELIELKQAHYGKTLPNVESELSTIYGHLKRINKQINANGKKQEMSVYSTTHTDQLNARYKSYLSLRKAEADHQAQITSLSTELDEIANELDTLRKKLDKTIDSQSYYLTSRSLEIIEHKRMLLSNYYNDALIALTESYDLATGAR